MTPAKPVVVVVRDGWGRNPNASHDPFNAIKLAQTPRCDALLDRYPHTLIHTCCRHVGLPDDTMGNSEVGHQNIGAGRVVHQESVRISLAIEDGSFFEKHELVDPIENATRHGHKIHLIGIASDAGVHGLLEHLYACLELCKKRKVEPDCVCVHLLTDGRDTGPFTGAAFVQQVEDKLQKLGVGRIVSLSGRYYAMDRDNRWERVRLAYDMLTGRPPAQGSTPNFLTTQEAIKDYYESPTNDSQTGDEFITPRTIGDDPASTRITDGDTVIFYNYRGDRPRELTRAFMQPDFYGNVPPSPDSGEKGFEREPVDLKYVCMTAYDEKFREFPSVTIAFSKPPKMQDIAGPYLAQHGKTQLRVAESEKFPHVTFFFDDYQDAAIEGKTQVEAASPQVATYDLQPEMSADKVKQIVLDHLHSDAMPDFVLVNFANGDMVGHTGKLDAAIKAVQTVDQCVGELVDAVLALGGKLIVTADHGNAEQMFDPKTKAPHTAHTLYDVECIVVDSELTTESELRSAGSLCDVMPTALKLMGMPQPEAMTGRSLLI